MDFNVRASARGKTAQDEVQGGCDDIELFLQKRASKLFHCPLTSGFLQRLCPCETLPSHTNYSLTKTRKSLQPGFPLLLSAHSSTALACSKHTVEGNRACTTLSWFHRAMPGSHPLIVLWRKHDHKSIIQWKNMSCQYTERSHPIKHCPLVLICSIMRHWAQRNVEEMKQNKLNGLMVRVITGSYSTKHQQWQQI